MGDTCFDCFYPLAPNADERYKRLEFDAEEIDHFRRFARLFKALGVAIPTLSNRSDLSDSTSRQRA